MPECWVRYLVRTGELYEAQWSLITSGVGAGEAVASIGDQTRTPDPETMRYDGAGGVRPATAEEIADRAAARPSRQRARRRAKARDLLAALQTDPGLSPKLKEAFGALKDLLDDD